MTILQTSSLINNGYIFYLFKIFSTYLLLELVSLHSLQSIHSPLLKQHCHINDNYIHIFSINRSSHIKDSKATMYIQTMLSIVTKVLLTLTCVYHLTSYPKKKHLAFFLMSIKHFKQHKIFLQIILTYNLVYTYKDKALFEFLFIS